MVPFSAEEQGGSPSLEHGGPGQLVTVNGVSAIILFLRRHTGGDQGIGDGKGHRQYPGRPYLT